MLDQIGEMQLAFALDGAPVAERQQAGEPAPAGAIDRVGNDVRRAVRKGEARADDETEVDLADPFGLGIGARVVERLVGADHARHRVAIGDADAPVAEPQRFRHHVARMRGTAQKL